MRTLHRRFILLFVIILVIWFYGFLTGFAFPEYNNGTGSDNLINSVTNLAGSTKQDLFIHILKTNSKVLLINSSGYILLGIPPIISSFQNGFFTSLELNRAASIIGWERVFIVSSAHSVELIGIWLSGAIGLRGLNIAVVLFNGGLPERKEFLFVLKVLILALLIVAVGAYIEAHISVN